MCGFVGILDFSPSPSRLSRILETMNDTLAHRGPDDQGLLVSRLNASAPVSARATSDLNNTLPYRLGLAHKRLSILDLSHAAAQPMPDDERNFWIVYNGEIFNYLEIRTELQAAGETFRTTGDTEVILKAYKHWGANCLQRFNGMWAFILWDVKKQQLFCARDRFGIKPFYYYQSGGLFVAASEIKALLEHPQVPKRPDETSIYDYLTLGIQDHSSQTFFQGIRQLEPSHFLTVDFKTQRVHIQKWWDIDLKTTDETSSEQRAREQFRFLLEDSVRIRLRSDIPVGVCVSGGLDSSSVAYLIEEVEKKERLAARSPRKAFSACFEDPSCDDRRYIYEVWKGLQMDGHETFPDGAGLWNDLEQMTWFMDEPFRSSNQYSQWALMKLIQQNGIRVALSGQGSDEFLGGYRGYASVFVADWIRRGKFSQAINEWKNIPLQENGLSSAQLAMRVLYSFIPRPALPALASQARRMTRLKSSGLLQPNFNRAHAARNQNYLYERHPSWKNLRQKLYDDLFRFSLPQLLHYEDRNGMAFSIETRHPFLDHRLVEYAFASGLPHLMKNGRQKSLLRESMRGLVPDLILDRKDKKGFITPEAQWMETGRSYITKTFSGKVRSAEFLNEDSIRESLNGKWKHDAYNQHTDLWRPLNLEVWFRKFFG